MEVTMLAHTQLQDVLPEAHVIRQGASTLEENLIEYAGRVCYRSDDKMGNSPTFIQLRVREGHEDIIEHVRCVYRVTGLPLDDALLELVSLPTVEFTNLGDDAWIFSLNARNIRDFWQRTRSPLAGRMATLAAPLLPAVFADLAQLQPPAEVQL